MKLINEESSMGAAGGEAGAPVVAYGGSSPQITEKYPKTRSIKLHKKSILESFRLFQEEMGPVSSDNSYHSSGYNNVGYTNYNTNEGRNYPSDNGNGNSDVDLPDASQQQAQVDANVQPEVPQEDSQDAPAGTQEESPADLPLLYKVQQSLNDKLNIVSGDNINEGSLPGFAIEARERTEVNNPEKVSTNEIIDQPNQWERESQKNSVLYESIIDTRRNYINNNPISTLNKINKNSVNNNSVDYRDSELSKGGITRTINNSSREFINGYKIPSGVKSSDYKTEDTLLPTKVRRLTGTLKSQIERREQEQKQKEKQVKINTHHDSQIGTDKGIHNPPPGLSALIKSFKAKQLSNEQLSRQKRYYNQ